ncbi:MAG: tRNA uridine-5-carboxymethylaminomethyl(34) synthesis GTPase MnmE [Candidatus Omnitrophota bacterium]
MKKIRDETQDTIAAIATPIGESAIGIVRMSGRNTFEIADRVFSSKSGVVPSGTKPFRALYGHVSDPDKNQRIDEVLLLVWKAPRSYTCEDMVEIQAHGGPVGLRQILELLLRLGARLAKPGEFTERAFLNGRIDLSQAEAILDIIRAKTDASLRCAMEQLGGGLSKQIREFRDELLDCLAHVESSIDFPDEDIEIMDENRLLERLTRLDRQLEGLLQSASSGIIFREGLVTVIVGRPNVGKSSLLNALLRHNRAIVTPIAGTTRDAIEEMANIRGIPVRLVDTAGVQETQCPIELEGVSRSRAYLERADLVLMVLDGSEAATPEDEKLLESVREKRVIFVVNKEDLPPKLEVSRLLKTQNGSSVIRLSALTGKGMERLEEAVDQCVGQGKLNFSEGSLVTNTRHQKALASARQALRTAIEGLSHRAPAEVIAVDLREALEDLGEVVGEVVTEDLLDKIFSQFCIGK